MGQLHPALAKVKRQLSQAHLRKRLTSAQATEIWSFANLRLSNVLVVGHINIFGQQEKLLVAYDHHDHRDKAKLDALTNRINAEVVSRATGAGVKTSKLVYEDNRSRRRRNRQARLESRIFR
ncbi:hypothetical protein JCM5353_001130, partial [Sporobolomyces roseus]